MILDEKRKKISKVTATFKLAIVLLQLLYILSQSLLGDSLAAEYLLYHLISKVDNPECMPACYTCYRGI